MPKGNSLNRVTDIVVRLGYSSMLFAGCDGSNKYAGRDTYLEGTDSVMRKSKNDGGVHPTMYSGIAEHIKKFAEWNKVRVGLLTPGAFERWIHMVNLTEEALLLQSG